MVMLFYGLANAIFSFSIGFISSVIGRLPILLLGFATSLSIISLLLTETIAPKTEQIRFEFFKIGLPFRYFN